MGRCDQYRYVFLTLYSEKGCWEHLENNESLIAKVKAHSTSTKELLSITKKSQMVPLALNIICKICAQVSKKNP